ncbi:gonadotropin-releasing hormone receptor isoform X2 [Chironomus tepperi]|uniref:gonadotropin-releasing hormone receptor isoform X2 n=1 Tax=Chironomus tepperi TaxID=113505 RepID=UPI00391F68EF
MMKNMIVPIETAQFYASSMGNYGSTVEQDHAMLMALNLTNDELCVQLRENLTESQQSQVDWASFECVHAPHLTDKMIIKVIVLSLMGIASLIGNVATIWNIQKNRATRRALRHSCSAIYALILHLSVADILVTFFCIIGEALWSYTVEWLAGDVACKLVKIFQMFALYLSTNVLVLIGIDRWVAVKYPMKSKFLNTARFVVFIYVLSFILSLPQGFIFRVVRGPFVEEFHQCVTFGFYTAVWQEQLYTCFTLVFMFIIPLLILVSSYISTFRTISSSERVFKLEATIHTDHIRRSDSNRQKLIHKAKMKSLRISVVIVAAFIICWTPYYAMMLIFMFMNPDERLSEDLQNGIFFFGMSNSLINPIIYGAFQYQPIKKRRQYLKRRDGSILHRSLSTNATTVRNLNNLNTVTHKYSVNSHESYSHEYPKVQNIEEEISLMSLEKDLKTLEEQNIALRRKKKFSEQLTRIFKKRRPHKYRK